MLGFFSRLRIALVLHDFASRRVFFVCVCVCARARARVGVGNVHPTYAVARCNVSFNKCET